MSKNLLFEIGVEEIPRGLWQKALLIWKRALRHAAGSPSFL